MSTRPRRAALLALAAAAGTMPLIARAQSVPLKSTPPKIQPARCAGEYVASITVLTLPPLSHPPQNWWETPVSRMTSTHPATQPEVISALLVLQPGDKCTEFQLEESERVLRAQPFIADAHIVVIPDTSGTVALVVHTEDEFSLIVGAKFSGASPFVTSLTLGDGNLGGSGNSVAANWTHTVDREGFGAAFTSYAFLDKPWQLQLLAARGQVGVASYAGDLSHPFFTDAQRSAWRGSLADVTLLAPFQRASDSAFNVAWHREYFFAGSARRVGHPGLVALFGLALSSEYDATALPASGYDSTVQYDSLLARYAARRSARINGIAQFRALSYGRGFRMGTVNGVQDLRRGVEVDALVGRGLGGFDDWVPDIFGTTTVFVGMGGGRSYGFLQSMVEARRATGSTTWTDAIASARLRWYRRFTAYNTFTADFDFGGGWNTTRPFELDLGQPDGGVRGYGASHDAGGERAALKLEDRVFLSSLFSTFDLAAAAFVDAGKVWAGDVPFGTTTPVKIGVGVGLLAATPAGSRRTFRVDLAVPVSADNYARWEVRFTVINIAELGALQEPIDIRFARELVSTSSSFVYPR